MSYPAKVNREKVEALMAKMDRQREVRAMLRENLQENAALRAELRSLTQSAIAADLGLTQSTISRLHNGDAIKYVKRK